MKILCIGDVVSVSGREMLYTHIERLKTEKGIDLVIANGENAAHGNGISIRTYASMMEAGVDAVTLGNHSWGMYRDAESLLEHKKNIIRPANYTGKCPGSGSMVLTAGDVRVGVINLIGRVFMGPSESPFYAADREIEYLKTRRHADIILVDFHAEATSEKQAMGWYLDGRVSAVFGTHTHVQTADETVLTKGTGYITDLGMTGPVYSILGRERRNVIEKFLNDVPQKFEIATGKGQFSGVIFDIDTEDGKCRSVERIFIRQEDVK